jgi:hypothetical protein
MAINSRTHEACNALQPINGDTMFVVLVNHTTRKDIDESWLNRVCAAMTKDLQNSFCPEYGLAAWALTTDQYINGPKLAIFGPSDIPDALGYHDVASNGLPYGDVFADGQTLDEISETISHELKELIGDLYANRWRTRVSDGVAFAEEACDAVQGTPYRVDGILCANHVNDSWYQEGSKGPWDHMGELNGPFEQTHGGYTIQLKNGIIDTFPPSAKAHARKRRTNSRTRKRLAMSVDVDVRTK